MREHGARLQKASTIHMIDAADEQRPRNQREVLQDSDRFVFSVAHAGIAVTTNAMSVRLTGCVSKVRSPRSPLGNVREEI